MATLQLDQLECIHPDDRIGHDEIRVIVPATANSPAMTPSCG